MASDIKISELEVAITSSNSDVLPIVQSNETKQVTKSVFLEDLENDAVGSVVFSQEGNNLLVTTTQVDGTVSTQTIDLSSISVTVDSALSPTSTNPVQNKVIYETIGDLETILTTLDVGSGV